MAQGKKVATGLPVKLWPVCFYWAACVKKCLDLTRVQWAAIMTATGRPGWPLTQSEMT